VAGSGLHTYYYRVAIVTDRAKPVLAMPSWHNTDVNKTLDLVWDAVAGVKATGAKDLSKHQWIRGQWNLLLNRGYE